MNKLRLVLKIVGSAGIALWLVCCFFGLFFATNGNPIIAWPITLLIGVLLFLSFFLMLKMQDKETRLMDAKRAKTMEWVWLGVYLVVMLFSAYYVNHLVRTYEYREEIREQASNAINELEITFSADETVDYSYREWVSQELTRFQMHVEDNPEEYQGDHDLLWISFEESLLYKGYENLESRINGCLGQVKASVVDNWYLPTVLQRLTELTQKDEWERQVVEFSRGHSYTKDDPYQPVSNYNCYGITDGLIHPSFSFSFMSILIIVAIQLMILLGYLISLKSGGGQDKIQTSDDGAIRSWSNKQK